MLTSILAVGFFAAFRHAAIPSHWLPFVLVGRTRHWSRAKTLGVVLLAGSGHVLTNSLLGLAIAWFGFKLDEQTGNVFVWIVGALLVAIGLYFCWRQWQHGRVCSHDHSHAGEIPAAGDGHHHGHAPASGHVEPKTSALTSADKGDWAAIGGLFVMLTLSPCEAFLPIYLAGVPFGWYGFFLFCAILAVATLGAMLLFTWLTLHGFERFKRRLQNIEHYEAGMLGGLFIVLGVVVIILEYLGLA